MASVVSRSVDRVFQVLELFKQERQPLRAKQIESALDLPQASTVALLKALVRLGYLSFDESSKRYFPTLKVAALGEWIETVQVGEQPLMLLARMLSERTGETVSLCSMTGVHLDVLFVHPGATPGAIILREGRGLPVVFTGVGRALLAQLSDADIARIIKLTGPTAGGRRVDREAVLGAIAGVRRNGHLAGYDLLAPGIGVVAMPAPSPSVPRPLALAVGGPSDRIRSSEKRLVKEMKRLLKQAPAN